MKLRKNRPHVQGATNKDFRKVPQDRPEEKTQLEFLATAKANNFDEMIKQRLEKTAPEPAEDTHKFYMENNKEQKQHTKIGYPRFGELEEPELRKRVFNGESYTHFDPTHKLLKVSKKMTMSDHGDDLEEKLVNFKHEDYTKQIQETQLVGIQHNIESLQGQVDLKKVKEIRRALRRRYANRKNFQKIYNAWDTDSLGRITVKNAYDMIIKLGIKANVNECRVLVASVDQDFSGSIGLDEFMDLIFNDSDNLNVDLNKIPLFDAQVITKDENQDQFNEDIAVESKNVRDLRHQNQLSMILKNKVKGLANLFRIADEFNSGFITQEKLEEILEKQNIPETIMSKYDRQYLFDRQKFDDYKFNYKQFINELNDFEFRPDDIYKDPRDLRKQQTQQQRIISTFKEPEDQRIYVFNSQRVNSWHLEKIRADFRKVKRIMSRYLENKDDFQKLFMQQHKISTQDELSNIDISKKQLTQFVQNMFLNVGEKDVKKHEIENFLSIFQYNNHDYTRVQDLAKKIYEQNDAQWYEEVQRNVNDPPPPSDLKFHPDFLPEHRTKKSTSLHHNQDTQFTQRINSDQDVDLVQPPLDNRRTQTAQPNMKRKSYLSKELQMQPVNSNTRLQDILKKLEDRVFCGSQRSYQIFKNFDQDKDGYVSQKDLVTKLQELAILNNDEIRLFLDYVDPNDEGQLNFRQFSDKIRDGSYYTDTQGYQTLVPGTQPTKEYLDSMKHIFPKVRQQHEKLMKQYLPDERLRPSSRFQYTPSYKNTFLSHRPGMNTPQYQSEDARFKQTHNHRTDWQKSELHKKYGYENARVKTKKEIYNKQLSQKRQIEDAYWDKQANRYKTKGVLQWTYEHRAHLQNNWHGGGITLVQEIREEKEKEKIKPPLYGKWVKN